MTYDEDKVNSKSTGYNKISQSRNIKKNTQTIKKEESNRPKTGKKREGSVEKVSIKKMGKFRKINGEVDDSNIRGSTRRHQSAQRRFNKIKI